MKISNRQLFNEAADLVCSADHVLANTRNCAAGSILSDTDCYDLVDKLERARNLLLVLGDRKMQDKIGYVRHDEVKF